MNEKLLELLFASRAAKKIHKEVSNSLTLS